MKLVYHKPAGFVEVKGVECFKYSPDLEWIITCSGNQLHSVDGEFIVFIPVYGRYSEKDSISLARMLGSFIGGDRMHEGKIKVSIEKSLNKNAAERWWEHVQYYTPAETDIKFNADTAIFFPINLLPKDYYQGKYTHLDALFLTKKGRGYINLFCFYTDKAKSSYSKYWEAIESVFQYQD